MQFRRSGQRAERRRRVLMDETLQATAQDPDDAQTPPPSGPANTPRRYSEAALTARQPPVTCLIPHSGWALAGWLLLGLLGIVAIECLHVYVFARVPAELQQRLTALDVSARGSVANWYSALLLTLAATAAMMVFAIRRHRLDDYHGYYRVWLPAAVGFLLASLDSATGLHTLLGGLPSARSLAGLRASEEVWWICGLWLLFGGLGLRLLIEIRWSRLAVVSLCLAGAMYAVATAVRLGIWLPESPLITALTGSSSLLLGHLAAALATVAYCRFVYRDAQQTQPAPAADRETARSSGKKRQTAAKTTATTPRKPRSKPRQMRVDKPHAEASNDTSPNETAPQPAPAGEPEEKNADSDPSTLSRSERRRRRKQTRREQRGSGA